MISKRMQVLRASLAIMLILTGSGRSVLAEAAEPIWPKLTPKLQELLQKEMLSVNEAAQEMLAALVAGDNAQVASLAQQIHDSFILQQSMTPEDKAHLMAVAPDEFVNMDQAFHEISGELAQAARDGNRAVQLELFGRMVEACTACHSRYATDRFPSFAQ